MVAWDESKRQINVKQQALDFPGSENVFDGPVVRQENDRKAYGEMRINLLGLLFGQVVHKTYTERGDEIHVIALRKASTHETRYYFSQANS